MGALKETGPDMTTTLFKIEGMHYEGCAIMIQSVVERKRGVRKVFVSFPDGEARILYDASTINEDQLADTIEKAGYRVLSRESS